MPATTKLFPWQNSPNSKNRKNLRNHMHSNAFLHHVRIILHITIKKTGLKGGLIIKGIIQPAKCTNKNLNKFGLMIKIRFLLTKGGKKRLKRR
jgi:hypothetical protein